MRAAMRCEWRRVLNTEKRCDAMQKSGDARSRCGNPLAMRPHDAKTPAMRCRDAGRSVPGERFSYFSYFSREGANRENLTVKKIINNEMFFFSPFMCLINREKLCVNREKSAPKIHHFFTVSFSPFTSPKNLFGLFLTFRVISILQGYFWRPSENTL